LQKISLVISNSVTKEVLEQWDFKVQYEGDTNGSAVENGRITGNKDLTVIQKEIRSVLRQILGSVSILPLLDCLCKYKA
jgi:mitotic spindle assembly checkpoint protein MAD2